MGKQASKKRERRQARETKTLVERAARAVLNGEPFPAGFGDQTTIHMEITPASAQRLLQQADALEPWTPFVRSKINAYAGGRTRDQMLDDLVARTGLSREECDAQTREIEEEEIYVNSRYQVNIRRQEPKVEGAWPTLVHLSIKRLDKLALGREHFRDLQRIKNELVGPECEGVEVYPAESRLVDTASQYHLWVFADPTFRLPWGFSGRMVSYTPLAAGSVQQPWNPADGPEPET